MILLPKKTYPYMLKPFKFFKSNTLPEVDLEMISREVQMIARGPEHIPAGYIYAPYIPLQVTEPRGINACIMEGYRAHRDNLPPGQCPYDMGTPEREHWMAGWSNRENFESIPQPEAEDELYMEVEDVDTGDCFGIPAAMSYAISYRGKLMFDNRSPVSGSCEYGEYVYWIDNVYSTLENTLVISVTISVPNTVGRGRTLHKIRKIIPYD